MYTYGDQFIGDWVDAKKHGEGELIYANGDRFRGQWLDDRASGFGVFAYQNGNRYEGQWLDDKRHGRGQFICQLDGGVSLLNFVLDSSADYVLLLPILCTISIIKTLSFPSISNGHEVDREAEDYC